MSELPPEVQQQALRLLESHYNAFCDVSDLAHETDHPTPSDTRAYSQILVSILTGVKGIKRRKGADLANGSDVKAASTWEAIDTPRFNNVIKAGTKSEAAGSMDYLDETPYLFLVLWDYTPEVENPRCRIWCVRTQEDDVFRSVCAKWYQQREDGIITSNNFQLHPPRNIDSNEIRNTCGNLEYPLLFAAERIDGGYRITHYDPEVLERGECVLLNNTRDDQL